MRNVGTLDGVRRPLVVVRPRVGAPSVNGRRARRRRRSPRPRGSAYAAEQTCERERLRHRLRVLKLVLHDHADEERHRDPGRRSSTRLAHVADVGARLVRRQHRKLAALCARVCERVVEIAVASRPSPFRSSQSSSKCPMCARSQTSGDWSGENCRVSCSSVSGSSSASVRPRACSSASASSERDAELGKAPEDERRDHRPLPHGGGDAFRRAVADVARREEADAARLERERIALERPAVRRRRRSSTSCPVRM